MRALIVAFVPMLLLAGLVDSALGQTKTAKKETRIVWRKTTVDTKFRSEGVAVADVNKDGKKDILVGDMWYAAPDWKPNVLRKDRAFDPKNYSESFAVFADDIDGDGLPDQVLVGFPGKPCHWYKNPGPKGGDWKEFMIQDNACNETPIYVDLLGSGKRGLILGHKGEMAFFSPGKDPIKPWDRIAISGPGKNIPGTHHFAHGLGAGDINGDGKLDVICGGGWWEQPRSTRTTEPWTFHPANFPACADMYAIDVDGDGKNDVVASAAHNTGFWWHQQKAGKEHPAFVQQPFFPLPATLSKLPEGYKFSKDESDLFAALGKARQDFKKVPWRGEVKLAGDARMAATLASAWDPTEGKIQLKKGKYEGEYVVIDYGVFTTPREVALEFLDKNPRAKYPGLEIGVGVFVANGGKKYYAILVGDRDQFALPGQTHALNHVDIDGDGLKDLVTGRRYWAHGPNGDDHPGDPAFLYWFKAKKDKGGMVTYTPQRVDDDSGIGTQFACEDINGDGLMDIIISNKRGVFIFEQIREAVIQPVPPPTDE